MARIPDWKNPKKRTKSVKLSEEAAKIHALIRRKSPGWDFSAWVSRKLIDEARKDKETLLLEELVGLQQERDDAMKEYEKRIHMKAAQLEAARERKLEQMVEVQQ